MENQNEIVWQDMSGDLNTTGHGLWHGAIVGDTTLHVFASRGMGWTWHIRHLERAEANGFADTLEKAKLAAEDAFHKLDGGQNGTHS
jgi:hypothetical protein